MACNEGVAQTLLGSRVVGPFERPYFIAEAGVNHEGSLEKAKELIHAAREGGADAIKFQSYKAEKIAHEESPAYWDLAKEPANSQFQLFSRYDNFEPEDYGVLASLAKDLGIDFISTPFDDSAVDYLNPIVPFFKVASADITNVPLLRKIASTGKPVVLSTGASSIEEIRAALNLVNSVGSNNVILMHCILAYPTPFDSAHIRMLQGMRSEFPHHLLGYSDHTPPHHQNLPLLSAFLQGACVLEKHFTLDKGQSGNDHYHSLDVTDLKMAIEMLDEVHVMLGQKQSKMPIEVEADARLFARRGIVALRDLPEGQVILESDLIPKRPVNGIPSSDWDLVVGRVVQRHIEKDEQLTWESIQEIGVPDN